MQASGVSTGIVVAAIMATPLYLFLVFPPRVAVVIISLTMIWGASVVAITQRDDFRPKNWIVPLLWALTIALTLLFCKQLKPTASQKWLVGLQVFRVIGIVFLIEMVRGRIPRTFAYPAGIGDVIVGVLAIAALIISIGRPSVPHSWVWTVFVFGMVDFVIALTFGMRINSLPNNQLMSFPTGVIPLFLVPVAIFFHIVSVSTLLNGRH